MDEPPTVPTSPNGAAKTSFAPFRFGKYEILEELGRGGMGVVYRAHENELDRTVAVKMILAHHLSTPGFTERFHAEAKAAAKVSHPNIVGVYETGTHQDQHYIAMEFVPGSNLAESFADGSIDLRAAARIVAEIARAVHFLHGRQVLHGDLKPSNILVSEDGRPVLLDFGLAQIRGAHGGGDGIVGTPGYVAPEVIAGGASAAIDASDTYSLGATLYEAATGQAPFGESSAVEAFVSALKMDPKAPRVLQPRLPLALETIILKCLDRDPKRRYASTEDLAFDLDQFLIGEPIRAIPPAGLIRARRWVRGHTALAARLIGFAAFSLLTAWNTFVGSVTTTFFWSVAIWLAVWAGASVICERLQGRHRYPAQVAWTMLDAFALTMLLRVADGVSSPLLLTFPLWIATSGFWCRVSLVVCSTTLALLSYGILMIDAAWYRPGLQVATDRHLVFAAVVILTGTVIGMQTRRMGAISDYLARRG